MTITDISHVDDSWSELARVRDALTTAGLEHDALLRAAQATLAADAAGMPNPLGWLREALTPDQHPAPGTRPNHYVPCDPDGAVSGRW